MGERQKPSEHGAALGRALAHLADSEVKDRPSIPERCTTCAFREGTVPNRMAGTLRQALDCVVNPEFEGAFWCHHGVPAGATPTEVCRGFVLACLASKGEFSRLLRTASIELKQIADLEEQGRVMPVIEVDQAGRARVLEDHS